MFLFFQVKCMADNNEFKKTTILQGTERKCPNCGGTLTYNARSRAMFCSLCGKAQEIEQSPDNNKVEGIEYNDLFNSNRAALGDKCKLLSCSNCGAELIYDSAQVSGNCPFCGSTNIVPAAETGSIMTPNGIIPFSLDENGARTCFRNNMKNKFFIPLGIKNCTLENLFPVYLPYLYFESDTVSDYLIDIGYRDQHGNVDYKPCKGTYKKRFADIPVFASSKIQNNQIDKIGGFSPSYARPFNPEYMAGYYAERNSITLKHGFEVAQYIITNVLNKNIPKDALRQFKGDKYMNLRYKTKYNNTKFKYILAPVYLASLTYKGRKCDVAINGKTGKVSCDAPSTLKFYIILLIVLLAVIAAAILISSLIK